MLADWRTAPIDEPLRATLGLLEALTVRPAEVSPAETEAVRAAGVTDEALADALAVLFCFNLITRMADGSARI